MEDKKLDNNIDEKELEGKDVNPGTEPDKDSDNDQEPVVETTGWTDVKNGLTSIGSGIKKGFKRHWKKVAGVAAGAAVLGYAISKGSENSDLGIGAGNDVPILPPTDLEEPKPFLTYQDETGEVQMTDNPEEIQSIVGGETFVPDEGTTEVTGE